MARLARATLEFEDGTREVLEGERAEGWRRAIDRALTLAALREIDAAGPGGPRPSRPGVAVLLDFLQDVGEGGVAVLLHLLRAGGRRGESVAELAEELGMDEGEVEGIVEKLRGWGIVEERGGADG